MKALLTSILLVSGGFCTCAQVYQRHIVSPAGGKHLTLAIYSCPYDTSALFVSNNSIIRFNRHTATAHSNVHLSAATGLLAIKQAHLASDALYLVAQIYSPAYEQCVLKYDLLSGSLLWQKSFRAGALSMELQHISGDGNGALYVTGVVYGTMVADEPDLVVMKLDTAGNPSWARQVREPGMDENVSSVIYKSDTEIYVLVNAAPGPWAKAVTLRMDSAGNVLQTAAIMSTAGPRMAGQLAELVNNSICIITPTVLGPSDPGPTLVRIMGPALTPLRSKVISNISPRALAYRGNTLLIDGQALIASGQPGFKAVRMDTALNVITGRHYNCIATSSIATSAACFIDDSNLSLHFFENGYEDSLYVLKTGYDEAACSDVPFTPGSSTLAYTDTTYSYTSTPLTIITGTVAITVAEVTMHSVDKCAPNSIYTHQLQPAELKLYPNPTSGTITIHSPAPGTFTLIAPDGRVVSTHHLPATTTTLTLPGNIPAGVYVGRFENGSGAVVMKKVVVQ